MVFPIGTLIEMGRLFAVLLWSGALVAACAGFLSVFL